MTDVSEYGPTASRRALRRIVGLGLLLVLLVLAGGGALLAFAVGAVDQLQAQQERVLVERSLKRFEERLTRDITTATVWDQAYAILRPGGDVAWADADIGSYYSQNRGHDWTVVIDGQDRPFYAWRGESRVDASALAGQLRDALPLVQAIRRAERTQGPPKAGLAPVDPRLAQTASGIVRSQGRYYVVGVSTVTPETVEARRRPGPSVVVVSAQRISDHLPSLREELQVADVAIVPEAQSGENSAILTDINKQPVGVLSWRAKRPGLEALDHVAPVFVLGLVLLLAVLGALAVRIRFIALRLEAHENGHRDAMRDLLLARDEAHEANRAKSAFLANMSHEIRTPLNGVIGMVQAMESGDLDDVQRERLKVVRDSGEALLAVINDILDLSKIEAGRLELEIAPFDLRRTVDGACAVMANLAEQKGVAFRIDIDPQALGVWRGDAMRVRQILSNFVANAVKFTSRGSITVQVGPAAEGLSFCVRDTGVGIPSDRLPELFDKFVQADTSTTRRFGGSGLGLAICREFVTLMGGTLTVDSVEGEGSTFSFVLPLAKAGAEEAAAALQPEPGPAECVTLRILAAEDNRTNQLVLKALLEPIGVRLTLVSDGREAVEAAKRGVYDLILMDVQMPIMDGVEATMAIRLFEAQTFRPRTPILALSANVMSHQTAEYLAAGMDGCVAKPVDITALFEALRTVLTRERSQAA